MCVELDSANDFLEDFPLKRGLYKVAWNYSFILCNLCIRREVVPVLRDFLQSVLIQRSRPEVFYKNSVLTNFTKFTGRYLC